MSVSRSSHHMQSQTGPQNLSIRTTKKKPKSDILLASSSNGTITPEYWSRQDDEQLLVASDQAQMQLDPIVWKKPGVQSFWILREGTLEIREPVVFGTCWWARLCEAVARRHIPICRWCQHRGKCCSVVRFGVDPFGFVFAPHTKGVLHPYVSEDDTPTSNWKTPRSLTSPAMEDMWSTRQDAAGLRVVAFGHAVNCAAYAKEVKLSDGSMSQRTQHNRNHFVRLVVACIVEDGNGRILLTQRNSNSAIFPNVWTVPAGVAEGNECCGELAIKYAKEATGIKLDPSTARVLCIWESNFPQEPSDEPIMSQHLVVFIRATIQDKTSADAKIIHPNPDNIAQASWVNGEDLKYITTEDFCKLQPNARVTGRNANDQSEVTISLDEIRENLTEGTNFALTVLEFVRQKGLSTAFSTLSVSTTAASQRA